MHLLLKIQKRFLWKSVFPVDVRTFKHWIITRIVLICHQECDNYLFLFPTAMFIIFYRQNFYIIYLYAHEVTATTNFSKTSCRPSILIYQILTDFNIIFILFLIFPCISISLLPETSKREKYLNKLRRAWLLTKTLGKYSYDFAAIRQTFLGLLPQVF